MSEKLRCPGSFRSSQPTPSEKPCPHCGRPVEIWSDEEVVYCKCGGPVFREAVPRCVEWCPAAEKCLGHLLDVEAIRAAARKRAMAEEKPEFVEEVCRKIRTALERRRGTASANPGAVCSGTK